MLRGKIIAQQADESILTDGKIDLGKLQPIMYDASFHVYRVIGEVVGNAFKDGLAIKNSQELGVKSQGVKKTTSERARAIISWYFISQNESFVEAVFPKWKPMNVSLIV